MKPTDRTWYESSYTSNAIIPGKRPKHIMKGSIPSLPSLPSSPPIRPLDYPFPPPLTP